MNYSELLLIIWTCLHSDVEWVFCISPNPGEPRTRGRGRGGWKGIGIGLMGSQEVL